MPNVLLMFPKFILTDVSMDCLRQWTMTACP